MEQTTPTIRPPTGDYALRAVLLWGIVVLLGLIAFALFDSTPGTSAAAVPSQRPSPQPQVLVFLHPRCPCSEATLDAIAGILSRHPGLLDIRVIFSVVDDTDTTTPLFLKTQTIVGDRIDRDVSGAIARKFDTHTSGQVLFYDASGTLRFKGGVTSSRGMRGESAGVDAIEAILDSRSPSVTTAPVFGCTLE